MPKLQPPKYRPGQTIGALTVRKVYGHQLRATHNKQYWYEVECECGNVHDKPQSRVFYGKKCIACAASQRNNKGGKKRPTMRQVSW